LEGLRAESLRRPVGRLLEGLELLVHRLIVNIGFGRFRQEAGIIVERLQFAVDPDRGLEAGDQVEIGPFQLDEPFQVIEHDHHGQASFTIAFAISYPL
jgi:hypothetical protein